MITSILYVSSATSLFPEAALAALLRRCREKNARQEITGMLLHKNGNFMQVLEGPEAMVRQALKTICADPRHFGIMKLLDREVPQREFAEWTMAFRNLDDPALRSIAGYSEFLNEPLTSGSFQANPQHAHRLLDVFRRSMGR